MLFRSTTAPVISTLPGPTTIQCPASPSFATPTATDACDPSPSLTFADVTTPGPPRYRPADDTTRTWTPSDHCGRISPASQVIHVVDTTAPVISTLPGPTTIQCPDRKTVAKGKSADPGGRRTIKKNTDVTPPGPPRCPQAHDGTRTWPATEDSG